MISDDLLSTGLESTALMKPPDAVNAGAQIACGLPGIDFAALSTRS